MTQRDNRPAAALSALMQDTLDQVASGWISGGRRRPPARAVLGRTVRAARSGLQHHEPGGRGSERLPTNPGLHQSRRVG